MQHCSSIQNLSLNPLKNSRSLPIRNAVFVCALVICYNLVTELTAGALGLLYRELTAESLGDLCGGGGDRLRQRARGRAGSQHRGGWAASATIAALTATTLHPAPGPGCFLGALWCHQPAQTPAPCGPVTCWVGMLPPGFLTLACVCT